MIRQTSTVASRMLRRGFLTSSEKRGDGVEADVSEHGHRGAGKDARRMKGGRIVERMGEESGIVVNVPDRAGHAAKEEQDDDDHAGAKASFNCAEVLMPRRFSQVKKRGKDQDPDVKGRPGRIFIAALAQKACRSAD